MGSIKITVGLGSCGIASGALKIYEELQKELQAKSLDVKLSKTGCIGICKYEPLVEIYEDNIRTTYINVKIDDVKRIIEEHLINKHIINDLLIDKRLNNIEETTYLKNQTRIALHNCGLIDCEDINDYINHDGYKALKKVLFDISKEDVLKTIKDSKLRGRGGAGFYTGKKWEMAYHEDSEKKYVLCNADEGDPGAFMDRSILEGDPFSVIEAMTIAAYTIGSDEGYIYVRAEYPHAVKRLESALKQAEKNNYLGEHILGSDFSFNLSIRLGAGAFVCGEETALMSSIEGKRGEPKTRPPYPTHQGLFDKPTLLNNVETYANITQIVLNGSEWFNQIGTEKSSGTKVFALGGKINTTGLVEVPIGTPLKTIIYDIGNGILNDKEFKAAQTGGPSGGCIPKEYIDIKMDYENLNEIGSMMGSGGLIVMDNDTCMVDIAKFFLDFTVDESCGKCVPCRIGTKRMYEILDSITNGKATMEDLKKLETLALHVKSTSFCGLGQSAPNPVLSTLKYFRDEYINHITKRCCPTKNCRSLLTYTIDQDKCIGCHSCSLNCPNKAIIGEVKEKHQIDQDKCIKCGTCYSKCKFNAINKESGK